MRCFFAKADSDESASIGADAVQELGFFMTHRTTDRFSCGSPMVHWLCMNHRRDYVLGVQFFNADRDRDPVVSEAVATLLDRGRARQLLSLHCRASERRRCRPESGGLRKVSWRREGAGKSGGVRVIYYTRIAEGALILLTLYAKSKTDNLTGLKLKEIRRALED
jgi:hypothetical protein